MAAIKRLDDEYFEEFLSSPEYEQLSAKNADKEKEKGRKDGAAQLLEPQQQLVRARTPPKRISFGLIKVNDRGKKQNRTLALGPKGADSLRGDTLRFHYDAQVTVLLRMLLPPSCSEPVPLL